MVGNYSYRPGLMLNETLNPDIWEASPQCNIYENLDNEKVEVPHVARRSTYARDTERSGQLSLAASVPSV